MCNWFALFLYANKKKKGEMYMIIKLLSVTGEKEQFAAALEHIAATVSRKAYTIPTGSEEEKRAAKKAAGEDIQNELKSAPNIVECDVNELAESMGTGHCVRGIIHSPQSAENTYTDRDGKKHFDTSKAFIKQTVYLLDFDNKTVPPRPELQTADGVREFINKTIAEHIGQPVNAVSVVSESVSSSAELRKWHAALVLETPINDFKRAKRIITYIVNDIFGGVADSACTDPARLIFGGTVEQHTQAFNGYLTNENIAALESIIEGIEEKRKAEAAAKAAAAAARIAKSGGADTEMKPDRLAGIILCAKCDFGGNQDGYEKWLSAAAALYHVAGIPSEVIAAWSEGYDGTYQNPAQWESMNRNNNFTVGTLKWAAELLNPTAFHSYKKELNSRAKPKTYFLDKKAKGTAKPLDWDGSINEPADTTAAARADFAELIEQAAEQSDGTREPAAVPTDTPAELTAEDTDGGAPAADDTAASEPPEAADVPSEEPPDNIPEPPDIESLTREDITKGKAIYDYIGTFLNDITGDIDEIALSDYCGEIEEYIIANDLKCKTAFKDRMNANIKQLEKEAKQLKAEHAAARLEAMRETLPDWVIPSLNGVNKIDENKFADFFLNNHGEIKCINGTFYDINGELPRNMLESMIYNKIFAYISQSVAFRARVLCDCLALNCYSKPIQPDTDKIHVKNGTLTYRTSTTTDSDGNEYAISGFEFSPNKEFCLCRMDVEYSDTFRRPDKWRAFLDDLLEPADQETLQEYMGYCMLPTTEAQTALFIIGQGGEGKSVIGAVMKAIFGTGMVSSAVHKLDNGSGSRFALAALVNRLVMVDDDIKLGALEETAVFKQIVTAQIPLEVEQKGLPSYQALLYSRIIAFGNGALSSLYDNSDGFWRRQLILSALPKKPDRVDNPNIINELLTEKDLIFNWALRGLERLMKNNFKFHVSERTKQNIEEQKRESNSIIPFMESGAVTVDGSRSRCITSVELFDVYRNWCEKNALFAKSRNTFIKYLKDNTKKYNIEFSYHVPVKDINVGGRARGFIGIGDMSPIPPTI
jgi:putative DNA primase/helicase